MIRVLGQIEKRGREFGTCHVADDSRWSAAFRGHNRDHHVLPAYRASNVLEVSTVSMDYHPQSRDIGQCVGTTGERSHRMSTADAFFEYEATRATCGPDYDDVHVLPPFLTM